MSDVDMDAALDALETEHGIDLDPVEPEVVDVVEDDPEPEPEPEVQADDKPPGYISYDDWVDQGKDPDLFKGSKAYSAEYDRIQEVKELKGLVEKVVDTTGEWKKQQQADTRRQVEQAKIDARAELEQAKDDHDIDKALAAQDKLKDLESQPVNEPQKINPILSSFFSQNPVLDESSAQFDKGVFEDTRMAQHAILNKLTGGDPELAGQLTEDQIQRSMAVALKTAKDLNPDKFRSKRNSRQAAPAQGKRSTSKQGDYSTKLKAANIKSKHNQRDTSAANDIYEMLKASDPKAAETFAKNVLGE